MCKREYKTSYGIVKDLLIQSCLFIDRLSISCGERRKNRGETQHKMGLIGMGNDLNACYVVY